MALNDTSGIPEPGDIVKEIKYGLGYKGITTDGKIIFESGKIVEFTFEGKENPEVWEEFLNKYIRNSLDQSED